MANLLGANIGTNYKGFLNLDSTINTPLDTTLRSVTDGMGTLSPLQLSTTQVAVNSNLGIGLTSGITARLHVKGDGTNPIAMFEGSGTVGDLVVFGTAATNAFPAIKRSGTRIDFRLANDSAYTGITASGITTRQNSSGANMIIHVDDLGVSKFATHMSSGNLYFYNYATSLNVYSIGANDSINFGNVLAVASAKVQIDSTTKGFLPPRMTTAQKTAITTPAAGLVVYDTTLNKLCVYTTAWEVITSV